MYEDYVFRMRLHLSFFAQKPATEILELLENEELCRLLSYNSLWDEKEKFNWTTLFINVDDFFMKVGIYFISASEDINSHYYILFYIRFQKSLKSDLNFQIMVQLYYLLWSMESYTNLVSAQVKLDEIYYLILNDNKL